MEDVRDLRASARAGTEVDAFEALYLRSRTAVFRYLRSRSATDDDAAELTAVTFERAFRAYGRFRPDGGGEAAWLLRIARNAAIDDARQRSRRRDRSLDDMDVAAAGPKAPARASLEDDVALRVLVAALPERQRDAVRLRYAAGLTAREIGVVMGLSEEAAQKQLERALQALKEAYRGG